MSGKEVDTDTVPYTKRVPSVRNPITVSNICTKMYGVLKGVFSIPFPQTRRLQFQQIPRVDLRFPL